MQDIFKLTGEVPKRKAGTGRQRKYGAAEVKLVKKTVNAHPGITAAQLRLRHPKEIGHLARRTVSNIVRRDLNMRACVKAKKPYLTKEKKTERVTFARGHRFWSKSKWGNFLFADEKFFWTKADTGGRLVRRPVGTRYEPKYTKQDFKKPEKIMF